MIAAPSLRSRVFWARKVPDRSSAEAVDPPKEVETGENSPETSFSTNEFSGSCRIDRGLPRTLSHLTLLYESDSCGVCLPPKLHGRM